MDVCALLSAVPVILYCCRERHPLTQFRRNVFIISAANGRTITPTDRGAIQHCGLPGPVIDSAVVRYSVFARMTRDVERVEMKTAAHDTLLMSCVCVCVCVDDLQVHGCDAANQLRSSEDVSARLCHDGRPVGRLASDLITDRARTQQDRTPRRHSAPVHVLQLGLSHLLVNGLLLHADRHHDCTLLASLSRYTVSSLAVNVQQYTQSADAAF